MFKFLKVHAITLILVLVLSLGIVATISARSVNTADQMQADTTGLQMADTTHTVYTQIYQQVSPSVVAINVTIAGRGGRTIGSGTGSGFVIDHDGHIVTNNHVVDGASSIEVEFLDGTLESADVVGLDPNSDLAVLQVNVPSDQLVPVTFGDSDNLAVGENVLAIGSPFGQNWTLTTGIVSGLNRIINGLTNFSIGGVIQTDAAINPGNSGGPLLNLNGQVVGVNSQILSDSGSNSGVGFSIPSNLVQRVTQQLIQNGKADYSYIGISGVDLTYDLIQALELPHNTRGVVVGETVPNGPAAQAGLENAAITNQFTSTNTRFDLITAIDGTPIKGMSDLISYLARETAPGQTITLTVLRNGSQTISVPVTLSSRPS